MNRTLRPSSLGSSVIFLEEDRSELVGRHHTSELDGRDLGRSSGVVLS